MYDNDFIYFLYVFHKIIYKSLIILTKIDLDLSNKYNISENDFNNILGETHEY